MVDLPWQRPAVLGWLAHELLIGSALGTERCCRFLDKVVVRSGELEQRTFHAYRYPFIPQHGSPPLVHPVVPRRSAFRRVYPNRALQPRVCRLHLHLSRRRRMFHAKCRALLRCAACRWLDVSEGDAQVDPTALTSFQYYSRRAGHLKRAVAPGSLPASVASPLRTPGRTCHGMALGRAPLR